MAMGSFQHPPHLTPTPPILHEYSKLKYFSSDRVKYSGLLLYASAFSGE